MKDLNENQQAKQEVKSFRLTPSDPEKNKSIPKSAKIIAWIIVA